MTTNEIALARAFRDAGIEQDKAEHIAETIYGAIRDNVATKSDLGLLRTDLRHDLEATKGDLQTEIVRVRTDLQQETTALRGDIVALEARIETRFAQQTHNLTIRGIGLAVTGLGVLFAALQHWPPH